jgi:hypothetical protein
MSTSTGPLFTIGRLLSAPVKAPTGRVMAAAIAPVAAATGPGTEEVIAVAATEAAALATGDRPGRDRSRWTTFLIVARQAAGL